MLIEALFHLHLIRNRLHTADSARYPYCAVYIVARAHEAAQLNDTLERLNFDLGDPQAGFIEDRCLDLSRDDAVIDLLAGPLMRGRGRAAEGGDQHDR